MANAVQLPDGSWFPLKDGENPREAIQEAAKLYPEAFGRKEEKKPRQDTTGFRAAAAAGLQNLKGEGALTLGKLGLMDEKAAEDYYNERKKAAQERFTPTQDGWSESPWQKFKETAGGSLPYMAAPAAAGLAAAAAPVSGLAALAASGAAGYAANYPQFVGTNLGAQVNTGKSLSEASLGAAAAAAVPQALLDTAAMMLMPGVGKLFGSVGSKLTTEEAKAIAKQTLGQAVADYTAKTGVAMGREGLTETTQQVLERLQAGLSLTDPEARKEYIDSFIGGAALAGAGAPVGRTFERTAAKRQADDATREEKIAAMRLQAEEAKKAADAEEARKSTPEYALEVEQKYAGLEQQKKDLEAQIIKAAKGQKLSEAEKAANSEINAKLRELQPQVKEAGIEFNRTKSIRAELQEKARLAGMSPEDFMLEQMGMKVEAPAEPAAPQTRTTIDEMGRIVETPVKEAAPEIPAVERYVQDQIQAARSFGALDVDAYTQFLMQDPAMAREMVKSRTKVPGLSRKANEVVLDSIKLQLNEQAKQTAAQTKEAEAQSERLRGALEGQTPGAELLSSMRAMPGVQEVEKTRTAEDQRLATVTPEVEALKRIGERPAGGMDQFDLSGIKPTQQPGIAPPDLAITPAAPTIRRKVEELYAQRDQAVQDMRVAVAAGERAATEAAIARKEQAQEALARIAKEDPETAPYASGFVNLRNAQEKHFMELQDTLDKLRRGAVLGGQATEEATNTRAGLQKQADAQRAALINSVLSEAALHRRANGEAAVSTDDAIKAADELNTILEEAITRMQSTPQSEEVVTSPAQMRGTQIVRGAETEMRDTRPLEERPLSNPLAAFRVFQEQVNAVRDRLTSTKEEAQKDEQLLRTQFAQSEADKVAEARGETATTVGGELRRRTEYVRNEMSKMGGMRPMARDLLNEAADVMDAGRATRDLLDAVEPVVGSINRKMMPMQTDLRAIKDALAAISKQAREGETVGKVEGQRELFTESQDREREDRTLGVVRTTPEKFANSPAFKKAQMAIEQAKRAKEAAKQAVVAAGQQEKARMEKAEKRVAAKEESIDAQRRDLQAAIYNALAERRDAYKAAAKAMSPQVQAAQKELDAAEKALDKLEADMASLPDDAPKRSAVAKVRTQKDAVYAARTNLDKALAEASAEYDGKELVAEAHQDSLVRFEQKALDKLQKELDKLLADVNAPRADVARVRQELAKQRNAAAEADAKAREARDTAAKERRQLEQRLLSGLGLAGVKRVAGEVVEIKNAKQAALDKEKASIQQNLEQTFDALKDIKPVVPQTPRATGPVTRDTSRAPTQFRTESEESRAGETRVAGDQRLSESRTPPKSTRAITNAEMEAANETAARLKEEGAAAQAEADRLRSMTPAQKRKAAKEANAVEKELAKSRSVFRTTSGGKRGVELPALQRLVQRLTAGWKNAPAIESVATFDDLPQSIKDQAIAEGVQDVIPGVYDPNTKKVYLIAAHITGPADAVATVAHEATGHFGLREMLGAALGSEMDRLYAGNKDVRAKADAKMKESPALSRQVAVEEVLADMAEADPDAKAPGILRRIYNVVKALIKRLTGETVSDKDVQQIVANARSFVIEGKGQASQQTEGGNAVFRGASRKNSDVATPAMDALADKVLQGPKTLREKLGSNPLLEAEMQVADMRAGLREALKTGDNKNFTQAMYAVLKADQKMPLVYTTLSNGPLQVYKDDKGLHGISSTNKNSGADVFKAVADLPVAADRKMTVAQMYMVAQRAMNKGLPKLDLGNLGVTDADLKNVLAEADASPELKKALENVRSVYNAYNKGLIDFNVQTGAIPKRLGDKLNAAGDYVPFYRVDANGNASLVFDNDVTVSIGDIRRQPYLAELKGGDTKLLPLDEAIFRNTTLLVDKALTNMATKEVAYGLQDIGRPSDKMKINKGDGPANAKVIRFSQEPDPRDSKDDGKRWLLVDTDGTLAEGVPNELLVKSLEGSHLPLPAFLKLAGAASDMLRSGITRMPPYILRQLIRDPMAASFTAGLNYNPFKAVLKAGNQYVSSMRGNNELEARLIEKGLIQSGIFTGDADDISKIAKQIVGKDNQGAINRVFAALDKAAIRADSATRALVYENALKNGLSEVEADMMTMESMNFYKRGLSPTVQYAARLIPFLNAQIQGLNVLYKAATGKMPFDEQQRIMRKFFNNAALLTSVGIMYAMAMEDDDTFKNARPRDKYSNFFLHLPGVDEPVKIPIPYEAGYFFSLAVAAVDGMRSEVRTEEQFKALRDMFIGSIPGASSAFVPQIVKPIAEVWTNKNFFSGNAVESARLQGLDVTQRYNANTTELAKALSKAVPILSPIQIEHIARGYLGILPLAIAGAANELFAPETKGAPVEKRMSDMPVVGSMFQKKYGGGDSDAVYALTKDALEARTTFTTMLKEGRAAEAKEFRDEHRVEIMSVPAANAYRQLVGRINLEMRRLEQRSDLNSTEKAARRDDLEAAKQDAADRFLKVVRRLEEGKTTPQ